MLHDFLSCPCSYHVRLRFISGILISIAITLVVVWLVQMAGG